MKGQRSEGRCSASRLPAFLAGLLLGGLGAAVAILLLAPPRIRHVWQLSRSPGISPPV